VAGFSSSVLIFHLEKRCPGLEVLPMQVLILFFGPWLPGSFFPPRFAPATALSASSPSLFIPPSFDITFYHCDRPCPFRLLPLTNPPLFSPDPHGFIAEVLEGSPLPDRPQPFYRQLTPPFPLPLRHRHRFSSLFFPSLNDVISHPLYRSSILSSTSGFCGLLLPLS